MMGTKMKTNSTRLLQVLFLLALTSGTLQSVGAQNDSFPTDPADPMAQNSEDESIDSLAESIESVIDTIVLLSKASPQILREFHPDKCGGDMNDDRDMNNDNGSEWNTHYHNVNATFNLESDTGGFNISGNGSYELQGTGAFDLAGSGNINITAYGFIRVAGEAAFQYWYSHDGMQWESVNQTSMGFFEHEQGNVHFKLSLEGHWYNFLIKDQLTSVAATGSYQISTDKSAFHIWGDGANERSQFWEHENGGSNEFEEFSFESEAGGFSISGNGFYKVGANGTSYLLSSGSALNSSGYGQYQISLEALHFVFWSEQNGTEEGSGTRQISGSGTYYLAVSEGRFEVSITGGQKSWAYGDYYIYADGQYRVEGYGGYSNSSRWDHTVDRNQTGNETDNSNGMVYIFADPYAMSVKSGELYLNGHGNLSANITGTFALKFFGGEARLEGNGGYLLELNASLFNVYSSQQNTSSSGSFVEYGNGTYVVSVLESYDYSLVKIQNATVRLTNAQYFELSGNGQFNISGDRHYSGSWYKPHTDTTSGNVYRKRRQSMEYYNVDPTFGFGREAGGFQISGYGSYNADGTGAFMMSGSGNLSVSGFGYIKVSMTGPYSYDYSYDGQNWNTENDESWAPKEFENYNVYYRLSLQNATTYNVTTTENLNSATASGSYQISTYISQFYISGDGAYENSMYWEQTSGDDDPNEFEEFNFESESGGFNIWGNGYFEVGAEGTSYLMSSGSNLNSSGDGDYQINITANTYYAFWTEQNDVQWEYGPVNKSFSGSGKYSIAVSDGMLEVRITGGQLSWSYGEYEIHSEGRFWVKGYGGYSNSYRWGEYYDREHEDDRQNDDERDEDDGIDWGSNPICGLSKNEQQAAYQLIHNQQDTLMDLISYASNQLIETLDQFCEDYEMDPDKKEGICGLVKKFTDERSDGKSCSVFDIMGVIADPDTYLTLFEETIDECNSIEGLGNEYCKQVLLQEDINKAFGALLKTIDNEGLSSILFDDNLDCPSEEHKHYCYYKMNLDRIIDRYDGINVRYLSDEEVGDFFKFLLDIVDGDEQCPDYLEFICDSSFYDEFKTVVRLADGFFDFLDTLREEDDADENRVDRSKLRLRTRNAGTGEKSAYEQFFENLNEIVVMAAHGQTVVEVFTSASLFAAMTDYSSLEDFCSNSPDWNELSACTMTDMDAQRAIFDLFGNIWNYDSNNVVNTISDLMTDYDSIKYIVDHSELSGDEICSEPWSSLPDRIQDVCARGGAMSTSVGVVRVMGEAVHAMGPMLCPTLRDFNWLEPLLKDAFNDTVLDLIKDFVTSETECMSENFDLDRIFDIDRLLEDNEVRDYICGSDNSGDSDNSDGDDWNILELIIVILLALVLLVLLLVLYIQYRMMKQAMRKVNRPPPPIFSSLKGAESNVLFKSEQVNNIEKTLAIPTASTPRQNTNDDKSQVPNLPKQPANLPPPPGRANLRVMPNDYAVLNFSKGQNQGANTAPSAPVFSPDSNTYSTLNLPNAQENGGLPEAPKYEPEIPVKSQNQGAVTAGRAPVFSPDSNTYSTLNLPNAQEKGGLPEAPKYEPEIPVKSQNKGAVTAGRAPVIVRESNAYSPLELPNAPENEGVPEAPKYETEVPARGSSPSESGVSSAFFSGSGNSDSLPGVDEIGEFR